VARRGESPRICSATRRTRVIAHARVAMKLRRELCATLGRHDDNEARDSLVIRALVTAISALLCRAFISRVSGTILSDTKLLSFDYFISANKHEKKREEEEEINGGKRLRAREMS